MILKRHPRRGALLAGFLILVSPVLERAQASNRDQDEVSAFLRFDGGHHLPSRLADGDL